MYFVFSDTPCIVWFRVRDAVCKHLIDNKAECHRVIVFKMDWDGLAFCRRWLKISYKLRDPIAEEFSVQDQSSFSGPMATLILLSDLKYLVEISHTVVWAATEDHTHWRVVGRIGVHGLWSWYSRCLNLRRLARLLHWVSTVCISILGQSKCAKNCEISPITNTIKT